MKKLIIIGGGFTGTQCAIKLEGKFQTTLIDCKPYFEFTPSILRTILEPEHEKKIQVSHSDYLRKTKIVFGEVVEVTNNCVKTRTESYDYDYLIIASGSKYSVPIKEEGLVPAQRAAELKEYHDKLENSNKVLIIGGGLVGVELAAEIITHYPNKEMMLWHSKNELIPRNNLKSRKYCFDFLNKRGVKIFFNEVGSKKRGNHFVSDRGTSYDPDIAFLCTGIKPNYEFMKKNFFGVLNERKNIKVNEYLQVLGYDNIFCGGDIAGHKEEKTAQSAEKQAKVIANNIIRLEMNKELKKYVPSSKPFVISLGKYNGIFEYKNFMLKGILAALMKKAIEIKTMRKYK